MRRKETVEFRLNIENSRALQGLSNDEYDGLTSSSSDTLTTGSSAVLRRNREVTSSAHRGETLDFLFDGKLRIFQSRTGYRFSLDALLLAHFVTIKGREKIVDLGTGNGVIPLVLATLHRSAILTGVELQPAMIERARRNVQLNSLERRIQILSGDVRTGEHIAAAESFDVAVCNPPYRKPGSGRISPNDERQIARHETRGDLGDFLRTGAFLLRPKGRLAIVYSAGRSIDLLSAMREARIEPKRMRIVHSFAGVEASLVLVEGVKGGRSGVEVLAPLTVYRRGKEYTEEVAVMIAGTSRGTVQSSTLKPGFGL
jgi:tRNA1(Val) A37 N6-methylase TrmN6